MILEKFNSFGNALSRKEQSEIKGGAVSDCFFAITDPIWGGFSFSGLCNGTSSQCQGWSAQNCSAILAGSSSGSTCTRTCVSVE